MFDPQSTAIPCHIVRLPLQLLDELSASHRTMNPQNPKIKTLARALYDEQGNEITDVRKLEYGQEVWLSFGEPFIIPFSKCFTALPGS